MDKLYETGFFIGEWQVVPAEGVLLSGDNVIHLEPKVMEVLVYFAMRSGQVISREELERDVWHGAIVGYDAITVTVIKLRKALQDNAKKPRFIATIPKRGYQFIAEISKSNNGDNRNSASSADTFSDDKSQNKNPNSVKLIALLFFSAAVLTGLISLVITLPLKSSHVAAPTIIVMPFENLSEDVEHGDFVDGMTEDLITDLSRLSDLLVMSSNTSYGYKGRHVSPQEVRAELDVDYILKGNIQRSNEAIRINVQLIDTKTGFNTWAERYDKKVAGVFSIQSEVTKSIVKALSINITNKESQQLAQKATMNLDAYDLFQEGQRLSKISTKETHIQAREVFRKSIELDPIYGRAYGSIAYTLAFDFLRGWSDNPVETLERALTLAEQAVALNDSVPQTYWALGYVYLMRKEFDKAKNAVSQAIKIAPNYADGYGLLALISNNLGESEKAIEYVTKGMQINPYYTWDYPYNLGRANYMLGNYDAAIISLEQAQERNENAMPIKMFLATSYVKAGRLDDAEWIVEQMKILNPVSSLSHLNRSIPIVNSKLKMEFLADLRKAGLPE